MNQYQGTNTKKTLVMEMSQSKYIPEWSSEIAKMPQGTGTTVKEVAGVDPEVKTNIRKVDL